MQYDVYLAKGYPKARAVLEEALKDVKFTGNPFINTLVTFDVFDENYQEALDRLSLKSEDIDKMSHADALQYARIYGYIVDHKEQTVLQQRIFGELRIGGWQRS
jgi:hypothetical protein